MAPYFLHLPNGHTLTVTHIFGGLQFKSNELSNHHENAAFPPGWTVVINTVDGGEENEDSPVLATDDAQLHGHSRKVIHPYNKPTLRHDHLFISSISQPPSSDFKPVSSQARQIAMMLWATLLWYFQQPEPDNRILTRQSIHMSPTGRPKADWRVTINREGVFKSSLILPKLEKMGLIASEDSCVGVDRDERLGEGWTEMFVSRRTFWQLDARIYLFTLRPAPGSPYPGGTPTHSRPNSPNRLGDRMMEDRPSTLGMTPSAPNVSAIAGIQSPTPFTSASHIPTFFPPPPPQYVYTNGMRHPLRPKPGRQGEIVYTRYIPSFGQYLSFRIASTSARLSQYTGPMSTSAMLASSRASMSDSALPAAGMLHNDQTDVDLLHKWMNNPRVDKFWGESGEWAKQEKFLKRNLNSKHSVPLIGCWDGRPFGYFEVYWVKEDVLGRLLGDASNYDRGKPSLLWPDNHH